MEEPKVTRAPARWGGGGAFLPLALMLILSAHLGCETIGPDEQHPNRAPNTVFVAPTPAPDTLIQLPSVTLKWTGTDMDGDAIAASYYRLSPRDTSWTRISGGQPGQVTFHDLPDADYDFCVYVVDSRGLADPEPTCRRFTVDVYRVGEIMIYTWVTRDSLYGFRWEVEGSEIPEDSLTVSIWPVVFDLYTDLVIDDGFEYVTTRADTIITPEEGRRYCLSVFAEHRADSTLAPQPKRACMPPY